MRTKVILSVLTCAATLGVVLVPSVHAYDLTGTWVGKWSCKGFDGAKFTDSNKSSTMVVTQTGDTMSVDIDNGEFHYNGGAITDTKKPEKGEGVFHQCPTSNLPLQVTESEIIRISAKTKPGSVKAALKGVSIFDNSDGGPAVGTCKYSYKRTDGANPNVSACPL